MSLEVFLRKRSKGSSATLGSTCNKFTPESVKDWFSVRIETKINLSEAQGLALEKLRALVGNEHVDLILARGPDVIVRVLTLLTANIPVVYSA